ncbi:murein biosynthesis integral membrane protein MurJ [soil metagenome]
MSTIGRAAIVVSSGILASRLLGFLRDVILAALLGRGVEADLYNQAFAIPDFLFFLMAGGYISITLVPILSRHLAVDDTAGANRSFTAVAKAVGGLMALLTVVTMILARPLTEAVFAGVPQEQLPELVTLVRIVLPAQFFFVMGALLMAAQYAHRRFVVPTLAPLVYNLSIIAGGLIAAALGEPGPAGFIWGALAGVILGNFGLQWWGAARLGVRLERGVSVKHEAVPEYFVLALPLMIGQSAVALDEVFMRVFGQLGGLGDTSALNYARRVNMVPVGVIAQAAGVAAFPFLAGLYAEGKLTEMAATVGRALRSSFAVAGLAAAAAVGLAAPIIQVAYRRGAFTDEDTILVSGLLAIYGLSIPLWAAHQVYTRAFYAQTRMWLPVGIGTATTVIAIPLYWWGATSLGASGVAVASVSVMAIYTVTMAWVWHRRHPSPETFAALGRMLIAAVPAGGLGWLTVRLFGLGPGTSTWEAAAALVVGGLVTLISYTGILRAARSPELDLVINRWRRRRYDDTR